MWCTAFFHANLCAQVPIVPPSEQTAAIGSEVFFDAGRLFQVLVALVVAIIEAVMNHLLAGLLPYDFRRVWPRHVRLKLFERVLLAALLANVGSLLLRCAGYDDLLRQGDSLTMFLEDFRAPRLIIWHESASSVNWVQLTFNWWLLLLRLEFII